MPAGRFIVSASVLAAGHDIALPTDVAYQARDVLRLAQGDQLILLDGKGGEWGATITEVGRTRVIVRLDDRRESATEARTRVVVYQGMLKAAKFEWVLQKGTELGVAAFVPLLTERAVSGVGDTGDAKRSRWRRILDEATEQCGRATVPALSEPLTLARALAGVPSGARAIIPWEEEHTVSLRAALGDSAASVGGGVDARDGKREIHIFIGPEGGFSAAEIALARQHGAQSATLGPRVLRAETAAIVAVALVMEACGELG